VGRRSYAAGDEGLEVFQFRGHGRIAHDAVFNLAPGPAVRDCAQIFSRPLGFGQCVRRADFQFA
jgi:hypothetical protein